MTPSTIWAHLGSVGQLAVSIPTGAAAIVAFYWSNLRPRAQHLAILDLATRRIAFWDQCLKLELSATDDPQQQQQARLRTLDAVERIRSHADRELERSSWTHKTDQLVFKKGTLFSIHWPPSLTVAKKFEWLVDKFLCWYFLALALLVLLLLVSRILSGYHHVAQQLLGVAMFFASLLVARFYAFAAERLALDDRPAPPMLDRL